MSEVIGSYAIKTSYFLSTYFFEYLLQLDLSFNHIMKANLTPTLRNSRKAMKKVYKFNYVKQFHIELTNKTTQRNIFLQMNLMKKNCYHG